ncbi:PREDICTED: LOW QUALITY PROTEIN: probable disease resistance protein At5g45440 [Camelina sativa]|uniref:LOW QUALITY PROTEIN: probable disease resistance protein At5g45440 n=1 Tax=Camelina sativa TaxID=90675 RepID=A0ABM1QPM1_CAMSA|nr:PREDICTED: LOW QUALITY PROTEIN: probable disease resistance protein At5g45440 [Camelina sativa]
MAPEMSRQGEAKGTFPKHFHDQYEKWLNPRTEDNNKSTKTNHLCAGTLEKRFKDDEEDRVVTDSSPPGHYIHGFENEIKSLKTFLLDQKVYKEFKSLVIVGEYGVGKQTTLCKMIFNDYHVKSVYAPRIWVSMHSNESKEGLNGEICVLKKILKGLGVEDSIFESIRREVVEEVANMMEAGEIDGETAEEKEVAALLYALHLNLRWKKYLIVFDDVRDEDNWDESLQDDEEKLKKEKKWGKYLSDGFPEGSGGRVIYTTRDEKETLAKKLVAEEHEIHRLWPLNDTGSVWNIYKEALEDNEETLPRNDKKCIDELMNKSRGLPLAARLLATLVPVFLDDEKADQNGSISGTTEPANNTIPEEMGTIPPQKA